MDYPSLDQDAKHVSVITPLWDADYMDKVVPLLRLAKAEILLTTFKMEPKNTVRARRVRTILDHITSAQSRGVDVRVLLNYNSNKKNTANINLFAARVLAAAGIVARYIFSERILHAKILIIDGQYLISGSHNFSVLSHDRNVEFSLILESGQLIQDVRARFMDLWTNSHPFPGIAPRDQQKKGAV